MLIVVCDAPDVKAAVQQAIEKAALQWRCDANILTIYGVAEGDLSTLDRD